jgi:hypothetical protein
LFQIDTGEEITHNPFAVLSRTPAPGLICFIDESSLPSLISKLLHHEAFRGDIYMLNLRVVSVSAISVMILSALASAAPIDSTLYTNYFFGSNYQSLTLVVCGSTAQTSGCYGSAGLGPFGKVGAMIEGNPSYNLKTKTVTRRIYIVDIAAGSSGTGVTLYVYKKTDVITASFDAVSVSLQTTVSLPLTGGSTAVCSMAANNGFLFIGTNQTAQAVRVQKNNLSVATIGGFSPPVNVTSITSNSYGYVTVTFGGFTSGEDGFYAFGPNGGDVEDGGGAEFMLSTVSGLSTSALPPTASAVNLSGKLVVHPKPATEP